MLREPRAVRLRHLHAGEHAAVVRAVIAVVKQADVPEIADGPQEREQGARALGELEAYSSSFLRPGTWPPTRWRMCSFASSLSLMSSTE